ncbi:MAG: hypothetical protein AB4426_26250 [Xenococcaceae cyanobacterium]
MKKQLPREEAQGIANASDIPLELALLLKQKPGTTKAQRYQVSKALLQAELPGVDLTPEFVYKAITENKRKWLNAVKLFWYCQNPEKVKVMDRRSWIDHLWKFTNGAVYLPDIRTYSLQVKVLLDLGLFEAIDLHSPQKEYSTDSEAIKGLLKRARGLSKDILTAFNLRVTKQTKPIQFINHLLGRVGLHLKFYKQTDKGVRLYRMDPEKLNDPDRIAVLESLSEKWAQLGSQSEFCGSQPNSIDIDNDEARLTSSLETDQQGIPNSEIPVQESLMQKSPQLGSQRESGSSQRRPVNIDNTARCCEPDPESITPTDKPNEQNEARLASGLETDQQGIPNREISVGESSTSKSPQFVSENELWDSQRRPVDIYNTARC